MDLEDFEKGVGGGTAQPQSTGDDLLRQLDAALPAKDSDEGDLQIGPPPAAPPLPSSAAKMMRQKPGASRTGRPRQQGRRRRR